MFHHVQKRSLPLIPPTWGGGGFVGEVNSRGVIVDPPRLRPHYFFTPSQIKRYPFQIGNKQNVIFSQFTTTKIRKKRLKTSNTN